MIHFISITGINVLISTLNIGIRIEIAYPVKNLPKIFVRSWKIMRDFIIRSSQIISEFSYHLPRIFPESWKRMRRRFWEDFLGRFWQKFCFDLASSPKNLRRSNDIKADVLSGSSKNVFPESATHSLPRIREDSWEIIRKFSYDLGWSDEKIPHNLLRSHNDLG